MDLHNDHALPAVPPLSEALVDCLDVRFPNECPRPAQTEREIWMDAGKRALVDWLISHYIDQQKRAGGVLNVHK